MFRFKKDPVTGHIIVGVSPGEMANSIRRNLRLSFDPQYSFTVARRIFVRLLGLAYLINFLGWCREVRGLIGPNGILPVAVALPAGSVAPSLLMLNSSGGAVSLVSFLGLTCAVFVLIDFWPRLALGICWICLLSLCCVSPLFSSVKMDGLLLECGLLGIFFAPPRRVPDWQRVTLSDRALVCLLYWLLLRVMAGFSLLQLQPFVSLPTYFVGQYLQASEALDAVFRFTLFWLAPLLLFSGKLTRRLLFGVWLLAQLLLWTTGAPSWNIACALALGGLLLDDSLFRANRQPTAAPAQTIGALALAGIASFAYLSASIYTLLEPTEWRFINSYHATNNGTRDRRHVDFEGVVEGDENVRVYEFNCLAQKGPEVCALGTLLYSRFEAAVFELSAEADSMLFYKTGEALMRQSAEVLSLFKNNPFPGRRPKMIRVPLNDYVLNDFDVTQKTGRYWQRSFIKNYCPPLFWDDTDGSVKFGRWKFQ